MKKKTSVGPYVPPVVSEEDMRKFYASWGMHNEAFNEMVKLLKSQGKWNR